MSARRRGVEFRAARAGAGRLRGASRPSTMSAASDEAVDAVVRCDAVSRRTMHTSPPRPPSTRSAPVDAPSAAMRNRSTAEDGRVLRERQHVGVPRAAPCSRRPRPEAHRRTARTTPPAARTGTAASSPPPKVRAPRDDAAAQTHKASRPGRPWSTGPANPVKNVAAARQPAWFAPAAGAGGGSAHRAVRGRQLFSYVLRLQQTRPTAGRTAPQFRVLVEDARDGGVPRARVSMTTDRADFFFLRSAWGPVRCAAHTRVSKSAAARSMPSPRGGGGVVPSPASIYE